MPEIDQIVQDEPNNDLNSSHGDANFERAAARLAQEARQMTSRYQRKLKDITVEFTTASNGLASGELVKDDFFTLFEAVGALEIMDPKMDSGVVLPEDKSELEFDIAKPLDATQMIYIIDELMCLEIAWLDGYPISQTLFTSIHIDRVLDPNNPPPHRFVVAEGNEGLTKELFSHQVLHAYCVAVARSTSMVLELVQSQTFYEEEDFVTHLFGRELLPNFDNEEITSLLQRAMQRILVEDIDHSLRQALLARLTFRKTFLDSIFGQMNGWKQLGDSMKTSFEDSHKLATPTPRAFTEKVQRHLATSTPPRPKMQISWTEAQSKWIKLCHDVEEAPRLTSFWIRQGPAHLQRALACFAEYQATTLPRVIMQDIMFVDGRIAGDTAHLDLLLTDMRELVLSGDVLADPDSFAVEVVSDARHKCSRIMETFLDGVLGEYMNLYRVLCQNRPRIRRGTTQLISIFHTLEQSAAGFDADIEALMPRRPLDSALGKKAPLSPLQTWTRYYKLKFMADSVSLGFETDIYLPDELATMYWYLARLLHDRLKLVEHFETYTKDRATELTKSRQTRQLAECLTSMEWYTALRAELVAGISIANALWKLYSILIHLNIIRPLSRPNATPTLLYEARFKTYLIVGSDPAPPSLQDVEGSRNIDKSVGETLTYINSQISTAKTQLTLLKTMPAETVKCIGTENMWKAEIKKLETTCVAISVASSQLKRHDDAGTTAELTVAIPPPEKRYHAWWIVPQVKQSK